MMNNQYTIEKLILDYLKGETSTEEIIFLSDWLKKTPENEKLFNRIQSYWKAEVSSTANIDFEKVYQVISAKIKYRKKRRMFFLYSKYAGIAAVFVLFGFFLFQFMSEEEPIHTYSYISGNAVVNLYLPDSTYITLNKNTTLTYTNHYGRDQRTVALDGEAYFQVTRNTAQPFIVDMEGTQIEVLGTVFNARNRKDEKTVSAVLLEGSIRFDTPEESVMLLPNQQISYLKTTNKVEVSGVDAALAVAWKENLIRYRSLRFEEVISLLEEQYDVTIRISDENLYGQTLTGAFDAGLPVERILTILQDNIQFQWNKTAVNKYIISK